MSLPFPDKRKNFTKEVEVERQGKPSSRWNERERFIRGLEEMGDSTVGVLITSLAFDGTGTLWAGLFDGILRGYDYEEQGADGRPLMVRQKHPLHEINCG
jgi:hypothetical protein